MLITLQQSTASLLFPRHVTETVMPRFTLDNSADARTNPAAEASPDTDFENLKKSYRITPMFEQYLEVKKEYKDYLLFYRMGDFYELFFDDAKICARELQLTLTSRNKETTAPIPMCGMPWHAVESYTRQLVDKGYTIAICEQIGDPKATQGILKREVTRIITPGTLTEDVNLTAKNHNYLGAVVFDKGRGGFVWADISTGFWTGLEGSETGIWQWVLKYAPRELIIEDSCAVPPLTDIGTMRLVRRGKAVFDYRQCTERLLHCQQAQDLATLGMHNCKLLPRAAGALLAYLTQTQKTDVTHLQPFRPADTGHCLIIDDVTERNLEIFTRLNGSRGRGTLRHVMDGTITPMGGRLLEDMLRSPLRSIPVLEGIQDAVGCFLEANSARAELRTVLQSVSDFERMATRVSLNRTTPRDLLSLRDSLRILPAIQKILKKLSGTRDSAGNEQPLPEAIQSVLASWDNMAEYSNLLNSALADPPPVLVTEGGIFLHGYNKELDKWIDLATHAEQKLSDQVARDQARAGSIRLKLGSNRVFGYYYEISKAQNTKDLPADFVRRQTLVNAERYISQGLKDLENDIVQAQEKRCSLEYTLYQDLRAEVAQWRPRIMAMAKNIAHIDYWQGLAQMAREKGWTRPHLTDSTNIYIQDGRHPVVEEMQGYANFVPNSFTLNENKRLCLLTGPNMAGKSTILRQVALLCLMAQTGSFVPAERAELGIIDKLFSRVGASDNLAQGQSTFMVEMMETARILRQATSHSLIILDEIGRGTSTYDGLALAWAVAEHLATKFNGSLRTLFATHYHELVDLEGQLPGVFTMNIAIRESNKNILFLHKLVPGPSGRSYGVEVARLAGVPQGVVARADELLTRFETLRSLSRKAFRSCIMGSKDTVLPGLEAPAAPKKAARAEPGLGSPRTVHPLVQAVSELDLDNLTPMKALSLLGEWKAVWGRQDGGDAADAGSDEGGCNEEGCNEESCNV